MIWSFRSTQINSTIFFISSTVDLSILTLDNLAFLFLLSCYLCFLCTKMIISTNAYWINNSFFIHFFPFFRHGWQNLFYLLLLCCWFAVRTTINQSITLLIYYGFFCMLLFILLHSSYELIKRFDARATAYNRKLVNLFWVHYTDEYRNTCCGHNK